MGAFWFVIARGGHGPPPLWLLLVLLGIGAIFVLIALVRDMLDRRLNAKRLKTSREVVEMNRAGANVDVCPICQGDKMVAAPPGWLGRRKGQAPCPKCGGKGYVPAEPATEPQDIPGPSATSATEALLQSRLGAPEGTVANSTGVVREINEQGGNVTVCPVCHGRGRIERVDPWMKHTSTIYDVCTHCNGTGVVQLTTFLTDDASSAAEPPPGQEILPDAAPGVPMAPITPDEAEADTTEESPKSGAEETDDRPGGHLLFQPPEEKSNL